MPEPVSTNLSGNPFEGSMPGSPLSCPIRLAVSADVPTVIALIAMLDIASEGASEKGFLRQRHTASDYERFADRGHIKLALLHDKPIGYVLAFPWQSDELQFERQVTGIVTWSGESYADPTHPVFADAVYVGEVGVDPRLARHGIGRSLYRGLMWEHPTANVIATTIEQPTFNAAAAAFHEALGFKRVGSFAVPEFHGLSPYQSGVYLRLRAEG